MFTSTWTLQDNPPEKVDCIVVLSYAVKDLDMPTKPTCAAIDAAYILWKKFPQAYVIVSTGDNQGLGASNAAVMATYAEACGIPRSKLIREDQSLNTYENLIFSREIVKDRKFKHVTVAAFDLHMRRTVATAKKMRWGDIHWISGKGPGEPAYGWKWVQTATRGTIFVYEVLAMVYSRLIGWV